MGRLQLALTAAERLAPGNEIEGLQAESRVSDGIIKKALGIRTRALEAGDDKRGIKAAHLLGLAALRVRHRQQTELRLALHIVHVQQDEAGVFIFQWNRDAFVNAN